MEVMREHQAYRSLPSPAEGGDRLGIPKETKYYRR
jgi:hypothetical protein